MAPTQKAVPLTIGVTSHRNIDPSEEEAVRRLVREFFARLSKEAGDGGVQVLSALAQGGDQLVAEEALAIGFHLVAVLPMSRDDYAVDFVAAARGRFDALCARATVIELPSLRANGTGFHVPGSERDRRYLEAGLYIASHCHVLLCIWDGKETGGVGGTAQIVEFHLEGTRPPEIERRSSERRRDALGRDPSRVAYHIVCSREGNDGAPRSPLRPLETFWRVDHEATPGAGDPPREFRDALKVMREFEADRARYRRPIEEALADKGREAVQTPIDALFVAADWLAIHFQKRVHGTMRAIYTIAAAAGIVFACYSDLPAQDSMIFVFLILFAAGVSLSTLARRRSWHRKYLDYRALAEGLRVQSFWRRAGIAVDTDVAFAHESFLAQRDAELEWIRNVMRAIAIEDARTSAPLPDAESLARVIETWVGSDGVSGQLDYYERCAAVRERTHHVTRLLGAASLWFGVAISVVLALFVWRLEPEYKSGLVVAMAIVSVFAAVREAYAYRKADKDLVKQYRFMARLFRRARDALARAGSVEEKRAILRALGEAALDEHAQWAVMHRDRPLEHAPIH